MPFDPSELTVKKATKKLVGLPDDELSFLYDAELEGKGRKSLLDAITAARDEIREAAPAPKPAPAKVVEEIDEDTFQRLEWRDRRSWKCVAPGRFTKVG